MDVRFLGHACFELSDGDTTVLIDPFLTGNPKAAISADDAAATTILLTHGHGDHIGDTVAIAKRTGAPVVAIVELAGELGEEGLDVRDPNLGGTVKFDWGWVKLVPAWHTSTTPKGTVNTPAGLVINFEDTIVYHLGDTCVFSDLAAGRQAHADRRRADVHRRPLHDGPHGRRRRRRAGRRQDRDPLPLQHVPADRDRRAGVQVRRGVGDELQRGRARSRTVAFDVTHAIVLIQADRSALATLGGELADLEGVAEAYSVTGEWDFVALLRLREQAQLATVVTGQISQLSGVVRTHTMVAFEVYSRHDLEALFSVGQ